MIYYFAEFQLNLEKNILIVSEIESPFDGKIAILFQQMIKSYPNYATKKDLTNQIWQDTSVSNWSLSKFISDTRKFLVDNNISVDVIETVHGRGFRLTRLIGEQLISSSHSAQQKSNAKSDVAANKGKFRKRFLSMLILFTLILAGYSWATNTDILSFFSNRSSDLQTPTELVVRESPHSIGRLLWVDDHPKNIVREKAFFESIGITVYVVLSTEEALTALALYDYKSVISDMGRGEDVFAGIHLLEKMRIEKNKTPFFMYTIIGTDAQKQLIRGKGGQGVAVRSKELYEMILPVYQSPNHTE